MTPLEVRQHERLRIALGGALSRVDLAHAHVDDAIYFGLLGDLIEAAWDALHPKIGLGDDSPITEVSASGERVVAREAYDMCWKSAPNDDGTDDWMLCAHIAGHAGAHSWAQY